MASKNQAPELMSRLQRNHLGLLAVALARRIVRSGQPFDSAAVTYAGFDELV